ncbi:MAG: hypothetical protein WDN01_14640 [Rhizomicrobium sp.]
MRLVNRGRNFHFRLIAIIAFIFVIPVVHPIARASTVQFSDSCIENWMRPDMLEDYGKAINSAVAAQKLDEPSLLRACKPGDHRVSTQIVIDRPVSLWMYGTRLLPTDAFKSLPIKVGATLTAQSNVIQLKSTSGLQVGMAIGGLGIPGANYIVAIDHARRTATLALRPMLVPNGIVAAGDRILCGVSSLRGISVGQSVAIQGNPSPLTITSVDVRKQCITLQNPPLKGGEVPVALDVIGSWQAELVAVAVTPIMLWKKNDSAIRNIEGQNIGGSMYGVWIADVQTQSLGIGRTLPGAQGIQISGWDRFKAQDITVENLSGSALIIGGNGQALGTNFSVREAEFSNIHLRDCGDGQTGQSTLEIMTPPQQTDPNADEDNQLTFSNGAAVFNYGEGVTIGTYNARHIAKGRGPRLISFTNNFQIEGGSHHPKMVSIPAPFDSIHVLTSGELYFIGDMIAAPGYGKSLIRSDDALGAISVVASRLYAHGKQVPFKVQVTQGSSIVKLVDSTRGTFDDSGKWDGVGAQIVDGASCTTAAPCNVYLQEENSVAESGYVLNLTDDWKGATSDQATLYIGFDGYFFQNAGRWDRLIATDDIWTDQSPGGISLLKGGTAVKMTTTGNRFGSASTNH